jgi:hypothetical protein
MSDDIPKQNEVNNEAKSEREKKEHALEFGCPC